MLKVLEEIFNMDAECLLTYDTHLNRCISCKQGETMDDATIYLLMLFVVVAVFIFLVEAE